MLCIVVIGVFASCTALSSTSQPHLPLDIFFDRIPHNEPVYSRRPGLPATVNTVDRLSFYSSVKKRLQDEDVVGLHLFNAYADARKVLNCITSTFACMPQVYQIWTEYYRPPSLNTHTGHRSERMLGNFHLKANMSDTKEGELRHGLHMATKFTFSFPGKRGPIKVDKET